MTILLADELRRITKGEILSDSWSREIYSVDASHYTIKPFMIACPSANKVFESHKGGRNHYRRTW